MADDQGRQRSGGRTQPVDLDTFRRECAQPIGELRAAIQRINALIDGSSEYGVIGLRQQVANIQAEIAPVNGVALRANIERLHAELKPVNEVFQDDDRYADLEWLLNLRRYWKPFIAGFLFFGGTSVVTAIVTIVSIILRAYGVLP